VVALGAREGDSGKGRPSRPFSASAGATVLVTGLVVVSYILGTLRPLVPEATVTLDWRLPLYGPGRLMLFEASKPDVPCVLPKAPHSSSGKRGKPWYNPTTG
jgi:hypothetical protein